MDREYKWWEIAALMFWGAITYIALEPFFH